MNSEVVLIIEETTLHFGERVVSIILNNSCLLSVQNVSVRGSWRLRSFNNFLMPAILTLEAKGAIIPALGLVGVRTEGLLRIPLPTNNTVDICSDWKCNIPMTWSVRCSYWKCSIAMTCSVPALCPICLSLRIFLG